MSQEQKEIINRLGAAVAALPKEDQMYILGRAEAKAEVVREQNEKKEEK